ncbi:hypothetical protein [Shewanella marina]|uniref:hypothetical protein n=1 Tax=Shewanella marina TaxID=487319 RepID=UPI000470DB23|nr:hypothetical protein [Shewanella marina]
MDRLTRIVKQLLLGVGITGIVVNYAGFFYMLAVGFPISSIHWFFLLSPWLCVFYGLSDAQQAAVFKWFKHKGFWRR